MNYGRITSQNIDQSLLNHNESSFMNQHNSTTRSISSSSASMISTPSHTIRKFQQQPQQQQQPQLNQQDPNHDQVSLDNSRRFDKLRSTTNIMSKGKNTQLKPKKSTNVNLVKNKLLNLQKSLKIYTKQKYEQVDETSVKNAPTFIRKPVNMNLYDYGVFRSYNHDDKLDYQIAPSVKESQIKAWESAEKITTNLIFDNDSDLSDDDMNEGVTDENIGNVEATSDEEIPIINSIPGYTKGELDIILSRFEHQQGFGKVDNFNPKIQEQEELDLLWRYRQEQQSNQERVFSQYLSLTSKRKIQVNQKKDLLTKIFGSHNTLNQEYITNNTSYSSLENVMNTSKSFHEDKTEINQLLKEDKEYQYYLEETKSNCKMTRSKVLEDLNIDANSLKKRYSSTLGEFDEEKFQQIIFSKLTKIYNEAKFSDKGPVHDDFNTLALSYLRRCIKFDENNDNNDQ